MGANNGTGQPYFFQCSKCRRRNNSRHRSRLPYTGHQVKLTGRKKPLSRSQQGTGGARVSQERREYECLDCGHVGWSRHKDLEHKEKRDE